MKSMGLEKEAPEGATKAELLLAILRSLLPSEDKSPVNNITFDLTDLGSSVGMNSQEVDRFVFQHSGLVERTSRASKMKNEAAVFKFSAGHEDAREVRETMKIFSSKYRNFVVRNTPLSRSGMDKKLGRVR